MIKPLNRPPKSPSFLQRLVQQASELCERHPRAILSLLTVIYLSSAFENSRKALLWHDELFTYWIAQAPSLPAMWSDLKTLDLNPPLIYLLTRFSYHLLGVNTLATRLPEILGFLVALLAVFHFVRQRLGILYGLFASALLMGSPVAQLSVEARPYALMLGCLGITLVGWQKAGDGSRGNRRSALAMSFFGCLGMLLSHVFSLLAFAALIVAELFRQRRLRRFDPPLLQMLCLPLLVTVSYLPLLHNHHGAIFPPAFQPDAAMMFLFYVNSTDHVLFALALTSVATVVILGKRQLPASSQGRNWFFSAPEWLLLAGLFFVPFALLAELMLTHAAFFDRYGAAETIAVVIAAAAALARCTAINGRIDPGPALLGSVIVLMLSGQWLAMVSQVAEHRFIPTIANSEPLREPCEACDNTAAMDPALPLVVASGLTFVEMNQRESTTTLSRIFYLTDAAASTEFAHANIFERMSLVVRTFHLRGNTENYHTFLAAHPHFFVLGTYNYPEDWLLRKLTADQADIRVLNQVSDSYNDREVYEVRIDPARHED